MRRLIALLVIVTIFLTACQSRVADEQPAPQPPAVKDSGATTTTSTTASTSGKTCECTDDFDPVCANNALYNNACTAECLGITNYVKGECHDPTGKTLFPCAPTSGGLSAQHNPVCGRVIEVETGVSYWKTYPNSMTACQVDRAGKLDVKEFTRGECGT